MDEMKFEFNMQPLSVGQNMGDNLDSAVAYLEGKGFRCETEKQAHINNESQGYVDIKCKTREAWW